MGLPRSFPALTSMIPRLRKYIQASKIKCNKAAFFSAESLLLFILSHYILVELSKLVIWLLQVKLCQVQGQQCLILSWQLYAWSSPAAELLLPGRAPLLFIPCSGRNSDYGRENEWGWLVMGRLFKIIHRWIFKPHTWLIKSQQSSLNCWWESRKGDSSLARHCLPTAAPVKTRRSWEGQQALDSYKKTS